MDNNNKFKKVLVMTVGTGATGADIAHGLFFSVKDNNPDVLILIGSQKSFDSTLPYLKNLMDNEEIDCEVIEKLTDEINDFEKLHFEYASLIDELLKSGYSNNRISVDYTSGTKAMSAALVSAALSKKVSSINYIYGERGEGGRVKSGTERRSSLIPNKIFSNEILTKAIDYFNSHRFATCSELLNENDIHPDFKEKVILLKKLALLFDYWDKFDFKSAVEVFREIELDSLKLFELKTVFEKNYQPLLFKLKSEKNSFERVSDLLGNAYRRAAEGKYDDAVARLYRVLEMIGQIEFEKEFNCSTSDVQLGNLPENLRDEIASNYRDNKDDKIKIPLYGTFDILSKVENRIGVVFKDRWNDILKLLSLRNKSILAHGNVPLSKKHFEEAKNIIEEFVRVNHINFSIIEFPKVKC